jgi:hypothetical protein
MSELSQFVPSYLVQILWFVRHLSQHPDRRNLYSTSEPPRLRMGAMPQKPHLNQLALKILED